MIPTLVNQILKEYKELLNGNLPHSIAGIYLHGSIALNAFDESSDLDFLTVVNRSLTDEDIQALAQIHQDIANKYHKPEMDGMYLQRSDIGKVEGIRAYPFYNDGVLHQSGYFNHTPITWWTLKHYGIRINGPEIEKFGIKVEAEDLIEYVHANMNSYWKKRVESFMKLDYLVISEALIDQEIEWSILGVLRQYYTIKEHDIISKLGAGKFALNLSQSKWSKIIQEAIRIREKSNISEYDSNKERISDAIQFLTYLIDHCNDLVKDRSNGY
jgi:hypothetical protein